MYKKFFFTHASRNQYNLLLKELVTAYLSLQTFKVKTWTFGIQSYVYVLNKIYAIAHHLKNPN